MGAVTCLVAWGGLTLMAKHMPPHPAHPHDGWGAWPDDRKEVVEQQGGTRERGPGGLGPGQSDLSDQSGRSD